MPNEGTLETIARVLGQILEPLKDDFANTDKASALLSRLGISITPAALGAQAGSALTAGAAAAGALGPALTQLTNAIAGGNAGNIVSAGVNALAKISGVLDVLVTVGSKPFAGADFPRKLFDYLAVSYLEKIAPATASSLAFIGLIDRVAVPGGKTRTLRLDRIGSFLSNPLPTIKQATGWGTPIDAEKVLSKLHVLFDDLGLPNTLTLAPTRKIESYIADLEEIPDGIGFAVKAPIDLGMNLDLPLTQVLTLHVTTTGTFVPNITGKFKPPAQVEATAGATFSGNLSGGVSIHPASGAPALVLLGTAGGSRIELTELLASVGLNFVWANGKATAEPLVGAELKGGKVVIDTSNADGFIATLTQGFKMEAGFGVRMRWTPSTGVHFEGSSTIEIQLPVHVSIGPIEIPTIYLIAGLEGSDIPIELSCGIAAHLGPLNAVVDRIGARARLSFPPGNSGNLGPANLAFEFKPPSGIGLSIDAGIVKGGGFLNIDEARGEYSGALELTFSGFLSLTAVGIINTKMPDGSKGFSLLVIITADFGTGIQLGFGFTLLGVGGLLGLNRTANFQPLVEGIRSGSVNSVIFPTNVVANAPKIISDLRTFFPPQLDSFLVGPMAKLGWGTPSLITLTLGVIVEIPAANIAILGVLRVALPTADTALVKLQVMFVGVFEPSKKRFYLFAGLFESRVLTIPISGEMGLLVAYGDDANFVLSVGGFHPAFHPPPMPIPVPARISIELIHTPVAHIRVEGYFAVTSNTVQFGARAELFFGLDEVNVQGYIAFDALFQFSPFYFIIQISASFSLNVFGCGLFSVDIRGSLEGPSPWRAAGTGSISLLFFDVSADFDVTWGESHNTTLEPVAVLPLLEKEFRKNENWRALPPVSNNLLVALRKLPESDSLVLHPVGTLRVVQRALPLELKLDKVGNQKPNDVNKLTVDVAPGSGLARKSQPEEQFAPAQFKDMKDAEKLSKQAYAPEKAGLELSASGADTRSSFCVKRILRYEEIIIDTNFKRFAQKFKSWIAILFAHFLKGSAAARSDLSYATSKQFKPFDEKVAVNPETYTVAFQSNNKAYTQAAFNSEASAHDFLQSEVAKDGNLATSLHVIASYERAA
jgi:hypothetical protein